MSAVLAAFAIAFLLVACRHYLPWFFGLESRLRRDARLHADIEEWLTYCQSLERRLREKHERGEQWTWWDWFVSEWCHRMKVSLGEMLDRLFVEDHR